MHKYKRTILLYLGINIPTVINIVYFRLYIIIGINYTCAPYIFVAHIYSIRNINRGKKKLVYIYTNLKGFIGAIRT